MSNYSKTRYVPDAGRSRVWRAIVEYLQARYLGNPRQVLDLGCGYGDFINQLHCEDKFAVDADAGMARHLDAQVRFVHTQASDLSALASESMDLVFSSNLLEHLDDRELELAAAEIRRVLRSGGLFVTLQPNYFYAYREYFDDYTHKKAFSHHALRDFCEASGFVTVALEKKLLPFSMRSRLPKSYWLTRLYLRAPWRPGARQMLGVFRKV